MTKQPPSLSDRLKRISALKPAPLVLRPELLLAPTIPRPLSEVNPRSILGSKWWNETRKEAYKATGYRCAACGTLKSRAPRGYLECHEVYRIDYVKGTATYVEPVALCTYCHEAIHIGRLQAMLDKGEISQSHYVAVIQHRDRILQQAGLKLPSLYAGPVALWQKWRLVLNGKRYAPKYKSEAAWNERFDP